MLFILCYKLLKVLELEQHRNAIMTNDLLLPSEFHRLSLLELFLSQPLLKIPAIQYLYVLAFLCPSPHLVHMWSTKRFSSLKVSAQAKEKWGHSHPCRGELIPIPNSEGIQIFCLILKESNFEGAGRCDLRAIKSHFSKIQEYCGATRGLEKNLMWFSSSQKRKKKEPGNYRPISLT